MQPAPVSGCSGAHICESGALRFADRNDSGLFSFTFVNMEWPVSFIIEIYRVASDGSETLLHRAVVAVTSPVAARREASYLLSRRKNATGARVLNA